jgi:hypothetical protein
VTIPLRIALGPDAIERREEDQRQQSEKKCHRPAQQQASQRKQQIERLFHRERPHHIPVAGQVAVLAFIPVHVKTQRRDQRAPERAPLRPDHEGPDVHEMKHAEHRHHQQQAGQDASGAKPVERCGRYLPERTPAAYRKARNQEA